MKSAHLEERNGRFYAILIVPKQARLALGRTRFYKSCGTTDRARAERISAELVRVWKREIAQAVGKTGDALLDEAIELRNYLKDFQVAEHVLDVIEDRSIELNQQSNGVGDVFKRVATGSVITSTLIEPYIEHCVKRSLEQKTIDQIRSDVSKMAESMIDLGMMTEKNADVWIRQHAEKHKLSASTVTRMIGFCRGFYRFLQDEKHVPKTATNIFNIPPEYRKSKRAKAASSQKVNSWLPFKIADLGVLFEGADDQVKQLIALDAFTGARIEELCSLKKSDVDLDAWSFDIADAKTFAGVRTVPIHSAIRGLIEKLMEDDTDEYLLTGLTFNKYGDRSNAIGKRFGRMKTKLGFGPLHVFHSIRKTLTTALENAGVPENQAADIVGHEKPNMTYGLYSDGSSLAVKHSNISKVHFPVLENALKEYLKTAS